MTEALPDTLRASGFLIADGVAHGLSRATLLRPDRFRRPFRGIRTAAATATLLERATAYSPLLRPWQRIGGIAGLALLGLPVPTRLGRDDTVEIVAPKGTSVPRRDGVATRRIADPHVDGWDVEGVPVVAPALLWALLASRCTVHELVMLGDAIVSDAPHYPGRRIVGPLASVDELLEIAQRWEGRPGVAALRAAGPRIRTRVESPRESDVRLLIVDAGMPEPVVQLEIVDPATGRLVGRSDLAHVGPKVVEEYEGDGHREKGQWDRDIQKYRELERLGWAVVRATNRDLSPSADAWLANLRRTLSERGGW